MLPGKACFRIQIDKWKIAVGSKKQVLLEQRPWTVEATIPSMASDEHESTQLREFDVVCIVRLLKSDRNYDGTLNVRRAPRIGDVATIVHEYAPGDDSAPVVVEMVDGAGYTIWVADFDLNELELVERS